MKNIKDYIESQYWQDECHIYASTDAWEDVIDDDEEDESIEEIEELIEYKVKPGSTIIAMNWEEYELVAMRNGHCLIKDKNPFPCEWIFTGHIKYIILKE